MANCFIFFSGDHFALVKGGHFALAEGDHFPLVEGDSFRWSRGTILERFIHYVDTSANITILGKNDGTTDFTNWAAHPTRPMVMRYNDGDCVTTPANFVDTENRSTSPIAFVQYVARGQVVTVFGVGDSLTNAEGGGIEYAGQSEVFLGCVELSDLDGIAYDFVNLGWSGTTSEKITNQVIDILSVGVVPDIFVIPSASPNDQSTITNASIRTTRQRYAKSVQEAEKHGCKILTWTWLASNTSVKPYGATGFFRVNYNDWVRSLGAKGCVVADFAGVIDGATSGGQVQMKPAYQSDGIHTNDSGKAALVPLAKNAILACEVAKEGVLIQ